MHRPPFATSMVNLGVRTCVHNFQVKDFGLTDTDLKRREIDHVDIAYDKVPDKSYKENEVMEL